MLNYLNCSIARGLQQLKLRNLHFKAGKLQTDHRRKCEVIQKPIVISYT